MNISLQLALPIVLAMLCVLVMGNYMINRRQGVQSSENLRETQMWGVGFFTYAVFDYFLLML
jgi:hypothetical protein